MQLDSIILCRIALIILHYNALCNGEVIYCMDCRNENYKDFKVIDIDI